MHFVCIVELLVTFNYIKIVSVARQCLWQIYVVGNNADYLYQF